MTTSCAFQGQKLNLHLASLSFSPHASVRGPAENDVVMLLLDEIMVDGFITEGEPLLITQPADLIAEVEDRVSEHLRGVLFRSGLQY